MLSGGLGNAPFISHARDVGSDHDIIARVRILGD
jgi:hypothetical protein